MRWMLVQSARALPPGKSVGRCPIRHKESVVDKSRITHDVGNRRERVTWAEEHLTDRGGRCRSARHQLKSLSHCDPSVAEAFWEVVEALPEPLDLDDLLTDRRAHAGLVLQVTRR